MVIADESHYLKNFSAKRTKTLTPLFVQAQHTLLLTGTPALSRPGELYSQLHCIRPDLFSRFYEFSRRYCDAHEDRFGHIDNKGNSNLNELYLVPDCLSLLLSIHATVAI